MPLEELPTKIILELSVIFLCVVVPCRGVKQGRFVILRFPLFCSVSGSQDTQMRGKNSPKSVIVTPVLVCPKRQ